MDPVVWWKGICTSRPLSKVAIRLLTAPCTSAATERSFSDLGHVHNAKRLQKDTLKFRTCPTIGIFKKNMNTKSKM